MKTKNLFGILILFLFTLLPFLRGDEKCLKGGEKILGTATIKDQNYKESTIGLGIFKDILHTLILFIVRYKW